MNTVLMVPLRVFGFIWQILLFIWIGISATFDWLKVVFPALLSFNGFIESVFLFLGAFLFTPMTWWQSLLFMLLPMPLAVLVLILFLLFDLFFLLTHNMVFV